MHSDQWRKFLKMHLSRKSVERSQMWKRPERLNMLVISSAGQLLLLQRFTGTTTDGTFSGLPAMLPGMITRSGEWTITGEPVEHVTGTFGSRREVSCPGSNPGLRALKQVLSKTGERRETAREWQMIRRRPSGHLLMFCISKDASSWCLEWCPDDAFTDAKGKYACPCLCLQTSKSEGPFGG